MLQPVGKDIWHVPHHFTAMGMRVSSRMTVVRLRSGKLWLHSPVPVSPQLRAQLDELGEVAFVVAPNRFHHLFVDACMQAFPHAALFGAPGLAPKRPDLQGMRELRDQAEPGWAGELEQVFVEGIPIANETVWCHPQSRTLILTDLCQCWTGSMPISARLYGTLTGVREKLAVPYTVRLLVKDRAALARSMDKILQWDFARVILAHNTIIEHGAHDAVKRAFDAVR
jgi:Domain of unknown function (DUF4336)